MQVKLWVKGLSRQPHFWPGDVLVGLKGEPSLLRTLQGIKGVHCLSQPPNILWFMQAKELFNCMHGRHFVQVGNYHSLKDFLFLKRPLDTNTQIRYCRGNSSIIKPSSVLLITTLICLWTDGIIFGEITPHKGHLVILWWGFSALR